MNKYVFLFGAVLAVVIMVTSAQEDSSDSGFLDNLCEKCAYCKTDPNCEGWAKCSECTSRKDVS